MIGDPAAAAPLPSAAAGNVDFSKRSSQLGASTEKRPDGRTGAGRRATQRRGGNDDGGREAAHAALDRRLASFPMTDLGNAERFRERNRDFLRWCPAIGWLWWDRKRWKKNGADGQVDMAEHQTVRSIQDEADAIVGTDADELIGQKGKKGQEEEVHLSDLLRAWGRASEQNSRITPIATNAAPYLEVKPDDLDADPFMVNIANGTLVIRRDWSSETVGKDWPRYNDYIRLKPHDPGDLITKISPAALDANAPRVRFDTFLVEVQPDSAMRRFLQAWKGYGLTGDIGEHRMVMFIGAGRNGKSVLEDVTAHVQGDYAETVPIETFLATGREVNANSPTPARALLHGARAVRTSEPPKTANLDEGFVKLVTGGEPIQARNLNRSFMRFYPRFKLSISLNHEIKIGGTDEGIWSRITKVPWPIIIPKEKRDRDLAHKLRNEASGILNWMLDGLTDWLEHGLVIPEQVKVATEEYRRNSDQLGRFLEACTVIKPGARAQSSVLHAVFNAWSKVSGGSEWSNKGLANALHDRGFKTFQSNVMWWLDIELVKEASDFVDSAGQPWRGDGETRPPFAKTENDGMSEQF
jgi:putative DNA primase/helicase